MAKEEVAPEWPAVLRSPDFKAKIRDAKVLCVGAGGIGCELLKTLVCTGFQNIEVIDLDTIETSNLNRQFLFRKHHVGESKARTASSVVRSIKPAAQITAHHANVKELQFGVDYISGFSLVLNGLDNLEARRHVNRLVMAANIPLVESGTAGYLGQVTVHVKGLTECFECTPKPVPKSFPICTLRNTPDKPIHCVVWAKDMLFARLFGKADDITDLDEQPAQQKEGETAHTNGDAPGAGEADANGQGEGAGADGAAAPADDPSAFVRKPDESALDYAKRIFERVYTDDIKRLLGMTDLWKSRAPPTPLDLGQLFPDGSLEEALGLGSSSDGSPHVAPSRALGLNDTKKVWSTADNARVFLRSILQYHNHRQGQLGSATFDKDDDLAVEFVTASSNLRCACYGIPTQSLFDCKGMAGNIIHAIATTNAVISGLIVVEALKLLAGCRPVCRATFLNSVPSGKRLIVPAKPDAPNPSCMACGRCVLTLRCNTKAFTLAQLVAVVKKRLAVVAPTLQAGEFMYEEGEGLEEEEIEANARLLPRPLASLPDGGLVSGKLLHLSDYAQAFNVDIVIAHQDEFKEDEEDFALEGTAPTPGAAQGAAGEVQGPGGAPAPSSEPNGQQGAGGEAVAVVVDKEGGAGKKRGREEEEAAADGAAGGGAGAKRACPAPTVLDDNDNEVVMIDSD